MIFEAAEQTVADISDLGIKFDRAAIDGQPRAILFVRLEYLRGEVSDRDAILRSEVKIDAGTIDISLDDEFAMAGRPRRKFLG